MPFKRTIVPVLLLVATAPGAHAASFEEVRDRVYAEPLRQLPFHDIGIGKAIFKALFNMTGELIDRGRATLTDTSDFKPAAPKIIHTAGVCADATWTITQPSFATGILAPRADGSPTRVRAMTRLSIASNAPVYKPGDKRHFGIAIKLFAGATSRNVFTLDQTGLTGDDRPSFFFASDAEGNPRRIHFSNDVPGEGFLSWLGQRTFEVLDPPSTIRALYPLAEVDADGHAVREPMVPRLIHFVPRMVAKAGDVPADFRAEVLGYGAGEVRFDIVLPRQYGVPSDLVIGSLELGKPVVSSVCDQELHFHHAPEDRKKWVAR